MPKFEHIRHKPLTALQQPRELILACAPMRSNVNLSRMARAAGCCGVRRMICCGNAKIIDKIARNSLDEEEEQFTTEGHGGVEVRVHRTLAPVLRELKAQGYQLVGLEQTTESESLFEFPFVSKTVLVAGNERSGLDEEILELLDRVAEIPVYGLPYSHNVAAAVTMALYEFCRQFPHG